MLYELMGRGHAALLSMRDAEEGQGTIEYVGLMVLMGGLLTAVVVATGDKGLNIPEEIAKSIKGQIAEVVAK